MFTVSDLIASLRHFYYTLPDRNLARGLNEHTVRSWRELQAAAEPMPFRFADAEGTLLEACRKLRDYRIHRLPILLRGTTLLCTLEHWRVLRFVHQHLSAHDDPRAAALFNLTIAQLGIGTFTGLVTVRNTNTLLEVLDVLMEQKLSAVPVVDEAGKLRDVYSRTDVSALARDDVSSATLEVTVTDALSRIRPRDFGVATCRRVDSLRSVFEKFEQTRKHRLYAVNNHGVVEGVVSLSDLLVYFLDGV